MVKEYIWLNPIVEAMLYERWKEVKSLLAKRGYTIITCTSGAGRVRGEYREYVKNAKKKPVIDARCPKITLLIQEKYPQLVDNIAPIAPILLACTEALYKKYVAPKPRTATLTVTAPCSWLVEKGRLAFGRKVRFTTWLEFCEETNLAGYAKQPRTSPVPPGFFNDLDCRVLEASGEQKAARLLKFASTGLLPEGVELLELLHCEEGCHRGDGI